jgi:hypothetical protein
MAGLAHELGKTQDRANDLEQQLRAVSVEKEELFQR